MVLELLMPSAWVKAVLSGSVMYWIE